jgi:2-dehydro-3-deoxyphosphogluconate aldolase/(4S)-4-hydroxy-2-oxoglutarate aldolase
VDIENTITTLLRDGMVLVFNQDKLDVVKTAQAVTGAGVNNMEVTCRVKQPLEKIAWLHKELPDFVIGCASLIDFDGMLNIYNAAHPDDTLPTLKAAADAGASYLVSAGTFRDRTYQDFRGKTALIPGCGNVTEVISQYSKGANMCKVFPTKQLGGPDFIKAIDAPLHKVISLVPMGGTNKTNMGEYIDAGVLVLGGSFSMIDKIVMQKIIDEQDYGLLADELKNIKDLIDEYRSKKYPNLDFANADIAQISKVTGRLFNL